MRLRFKTIFLHVMSVALLSCEHKRKERCQEFNDKYPKIIAISEDKPDTVVLINALNEIILDDVKCVDAYLTRADIYLSLDDVFSAKKDFREVLRIDTGNIYALYKLGELYQYEELFDSSIFYLNRAIEKKTHGRMVVDYHRIDERLNTSVNKYDVEIIYIYYSSGVSNYYKRNFELSKKYFDYCISHDYLLPQVFLYRGAIFIELNDKKKACEDFLNAKTYGNLRAQEYINKYCS